ncbi:MAG: GTP pyrophosphokinase family protein [Kurthia sp.]|nr:GTP pyrophosphokinase family protein [Candidatus Kurthia equi]
MMSYRFALDEINTKMKILKEEFHLIHEYNPIEHIDSRVKTPESIIRKIKKKNLPYDLDVIREEIHDIAGIRIVCSFVSDIYRIQQMISNQADIKVIDIKDYIENPKASGYQSLHLILKVPIFLSDRQEEVYVEMQIRTIAMDFWASLEHKIYYKYNKAIPTELSSQLIEAAHTAALLDRKMESLNKEINILKNEQQDEEPSESISAQSTRFYNALQTIGMTSSEEEKI